jgi:DNA-binding transcriptional LysR family regulator
MSIKADHIIRFVAVAEHLSFTKAAQSLRVDQPWLSQQIRQLENLLGAPLFIRDARPLRLTGVGARLLSVARPLADAAQLVDCEIQDIRRDQISNIRVGVPTFSHLLKERDDLVAEYIRRNPRIFFRFHGGNTPTLLNKIHSLELDAAIVLAPFEDQDLDRILMRRCFASLAVPKESELSRVEILSKENLRGHKIAVLPRVSQDAWNETYGPLEHIGVGIVEIQEGHRQALNYYARRDRLCTVIWDWGGEDEGLAEDMVCRPCSDWKPYRDIYIVKLAKATNPTIRQFWNVARSIFSNIPLTGEGGKEAA